MKRRLSVLISTIGDPKVLYLDGIINLLEPTTGMDPINRRYVWKFIESFKSGRVIILTTHSMEEAEVLSDRIAIMAHGEIQAIGQPLALKQTFSAGYKISIMVDPLKASIIKGALPEIVSDCVLEDDAAGSLLYSFPSSSLQYMSKVVEYLNSVPFVKSWGLSQTSLEQVFLTVIRSSTMSTSTESS